MKMNNIPKVSPPKLLDDDRKNLLSQLIPESVEDGKINVEKIKESLGEFAEDESVNEHFELSWPGKREAKKVAITASKGTLVPALGEGVDEDKTKNIFIEGENLEVLKLLHKSYMGQIKMIYIDPPYNTGKDFVYSDKFSDSIEEYRRVTGQVDSEGREIETNKKADGRFHSRWLSMMYPRLKLAKDLLRDDGVIFVSIDDNEVHNLKALCNEIFGEENLVSQVSRATGTTTGQDAQKFGSSQDYILIYRKSDQYSPTGLPLTEKDKARFRWDDNDDKGKYALLQLRKTGTNDRREDRPNMFYPIKSPSGEDVYPIGPTDYLSCWRVEKKRYQKLIEENLIVWMEKELDEDIEEIESDLDSDVENNSKVAEPIAFKEGDYKKSKSVPYVKYYLSGRTKRPSNVWNDIEGNKKGSLQLKELFDNKIFDNPKPLEFLRRIIQISGASSNDCILDFFGGSGTTAHANLQVNTKNNTSIKYILVQMPELTSKESGARRIGIMNIAELSKERIRRAGKKIKEETKAEIDYGFKVFKLQKSNYRDQDELLRAGQQSLDFVDLTNPLIKDWKPEDLLTEVTLLEGFPLDSKIEKLSTVQTNKVQVVSCDNLDKTYKLFVCLDKKIDPQTISSLTFSDEDKFICLDSAISDTDKLTLSDKAHLKVI